jgi:hypothetical protein
MLVETVVEGTGNSLVKSSRSKKKSGEARLQAAS